MIRTIVVDDEWYNLEEICDFVERTGFMSVESRCQNGIDALREADRVLPQAAFIDIEMPEMDGLTLAEKLLEKYPEMQIVFITGWNQYAVAAFELNALDYIMKPLNKERFQKMAERLRSRVEPHMPKRENTVSIRCFGGFEVTISGQPVIWRRVKAEELFAFLLAHHDTFVSKDIILENLWPEYDYAKALPILQTSVCKIRNIFSGCKDKVKLTYASNRYGLYLSDVDCDYLKVESALAGFQDNVPESFGAVENACGMLGNGLFDGRGYLWSEGCRESLRQKLTPILRAIADYCHTLPDTPRELEALKLLSQLSPVDDDTQVLYINALRANGRNEETRRHVKWLRETLQSDYGAGLPDVIKKALNK